ncbi:Transcriptional regulator, TetR family [Streptococcus sp. DD10]|uniref:TetR/AcrR family transcriptional regulator n=1 Tax=Streptococcus sp. DD10 TaxID=1777878 RepID=UPI0007975F6C|nr:TetR/AcrR family transcriptional regulator [Streptococcus sp. DD10]KXT72950.1 Transcriptional regulator, TetR family [Streptococcus sp. DD10]
MKKISETEQTILQLATDLIQTRGVNGFSYAEIATVMGIKKASIHYYFPKKQDLIAKVLDRYNQSFVTELERIRAKKDDFAQHLQDFVKLYRRNLESGKICLCSMLATEHYSLSESINQSVQDFFQLNIQWLQGLFEEENLFSHQAEDFFATVQGAQLIANSTGDLTHFDQLLTDKIKTIQKK